MLILFFIDHVNNYHTYDSEGNGKGKSDEMFAAVYRHVVQELQSTFTDETYLRYLSRFSAEQVHTGYFSKDNKGKFIDSKVKRGKTSSSGESA